MFGLIFLLNEFSLSWDQIIGDHSPMEGKRKRERERESNKAWI
jgi:hypothetical protein